MDVGRNEITPSVDLNKRHSLSPSLDDDFLFLRVCVPDLNIQKCFQFKKTQKIADIKEQCITSLPLELKQSFNYGLFCPPTGAKCGKFLDDDKALNEYPFSDYVGYLELRFKQRIYKTSKIDEKQFKAINTRNNLRRFIDYIHNGQIEKIVKMCAKGLDPNFHYVETGETPLTLACTLIKPGKIISALANGGAFLDFRNLSGSTPIHRAVESNNYEAVITLLELGTSPNCKDTRGLTPLYLSISRKTDILICEKLLLFKATIGAQDMQGWQEIHQACRYGLSQHLEYLLAYGVDTNVKNASGNTPLHVCAVNGQENCAKLLLEKGATNDSLNYANQTPYQVAVIAGNLELAGVIQNFRCTDADKTISDCSDVISNNSSGIGTANSDLTDSNYPLKSNDNSGSSTGTANERIEAFSPLSAKARNRYSCYEGTVDPLLIASYHLSKNGLDKTTGSNKYYATAPRQKHQLPAEPRTVVLHKTRRGFGFILRGAKATSSLMDVKTLGVCPALQYLDDVDKGSVADLAGLRKGDYLLAINGEDVSAASHERVVELIRNSGKLVTMTVVSRSNNNQPSAYETKYNEWQTSAPLGYATLPNKLKKRSNSVGAAGYTIAPLPPRRDPKTTLSVGKAKSKPNHWNGDESKMNGTMKDTQAKTASIRSRPISSRITTAELEELFQRQAELSPIYQDEGDRKRMTINGSQEKGELRRNFYSVPDLVQISVCNKTDDASHSLRNHKSQDNVNENDNSTMESSSSSSIRSHGSMTKESKMKNGARDACSNLAPARTTMINVNSSFNPNNNAVIYAVPSGITDSNDCHNPRNQLRKNASLHLHNSSSRSNRFSMPTNQNGRHKIAYSIRNSHLGGLCLSPPPIPDPDYSQSDEENEQLKKIYKTSTLPLPGRVGSDKFATLKEMNNSATQQFNAEEIRKVRSLLRSLTPVSSIMSANYTMVTSSPLEDGDNSSSGVSSDQEMIPMAMLNGDQSTKSSYSQLPTIPKPDLASVQETKENESMVLPPLDLAVENVVQETVEVLEPPPQFSDDSHII